MKALVLPEAAEVLKADYYRPAVSVSMPFEPKINNKSRLLQSLKITATKIEEGLKQNYPEEVCRLLLQRIRNITRNLDYNTYKKSIALFISPVFEKLLYLDIPLEEKIIIDDSFDIRDLVYNKKQEKQFLVLLLSAKQCAVYLAGPDRLERKLFTNQPRDYSFMNAMKEKVANFTNSSSVKDTLLDKFLLNTDRDLRDIMKAYQLPLLVLGTEKIVAHFKRITRHSEHIVECIHGNYIDAGDMVIKKLLHRFIEDWDNIREKQLLARLDVASAKGEMVSGVINVLRETGNMNGRLLVVENDFAYQSKNSDPRVADNTNGTGNKYFYVKDVVDEIIEKVLECGGDIAFVKRDALKKFQHIALIKFH